MGHGGPATGALTQGRGVHPEGFEDNGPQHRLEGVPHSLRNKRPERVEPAVRVDAASPWGRDRGHALERQPRRVRQQVADRRPGWSGRLVEVDAPALDLGQDSQRRRQLGDRSPTEGPLVVTARSHHAGPPQDRGRRVLRAPGVDGGERVLECGHAGQRSGRQGPRGNRDYTGIVSLDTFAGQTVHLRFVASHGGPDNLVDVELDDIRVTRPS